jgi:hypothetical protein
MGVERPLWTEAVQFLCNGQWGMVSGSMYDHAHVVAFALF